MADDRVESDILRPEMLRALAQRQAEQSAARALFGAARIPVTCVTPRGHRIVCLHNSIRWFPKSWPFHHFLDDYSRYLLGHSWGQKQLLLPEGDRHPVIDWWSARSRLPPHAIERDVDGNLRASATASMACWVHLGWDFYTVRDADLLTKDVLRRLRDPIKFQGARHELSVIALFNRAGFTVKHIKAGASTKTPEFVAEHSTGIRLAVEAKARQRYGVLKSRLGPKPEMWAVSDVYSLLRAAAVKRNDLPLVAIIDLNLPPPELLPSKQWQDAAMAMTERLERERLIPPDLTILWSSCNAHLGDGEPLKMLPTMMIFQPADRSRIPHGIVQITMRAIDQWKHIPDDWPRNFDRERTTGHGALDLSPASPSVAG